MTSANGAHADKLRVTTKKINTNTISQAQSTNNMKTYNQ